MKLAILAESSADARALRILADAILQSRSEDVTFPAHLQARGWPALRTVLPIVIKFLHFKTDAEALLVVADSNHSPIQPNDASARLFELDSIVQREVGYLSNVHGKNALRVAVGVATPAIEAWLLSQTRTDVNEAEWERGLKSRSFPYTKLDLKRHLYGSERYTLAHETATMVHYAERLTASLDNLSAKFPIGFGRIVEALRNWS